MVWISYHSVGPKEPTEETMTFLSMFDISLLFARKVGVFVVQAAGNKGPTSSSVVSFSLWSVSVAASTTNRRYPASLRGNGLILNGVEANYRKQLKENYCIVKKVYNSFPNRIPGTAYSKAISARRRIREIISEIICKRKEQRLMERDLLGHLLNYKDEKGQTLSDDQIADNVIGVLFAAQDTTASVLTWILKYLHDDQKLLEAIKAEQMQVYEANEEGKLSLTWGQTRNMPITHRVILESLRMSSIISFTFREAVVDVVYKGYLIPKGWKVMPLFRNIHHNPEFHPAPHNFDPSRFEVAPKPNTFMPFGNGVHSCPGNELAKLNMLILIHHLVTKYRWEVVGYQNGIQYSPFPVPLHGLPTKFWRNE